MTCKEFHLNDKMENTQLQIFLTTRLDAGRLRDSSINGNVSLKNALNVAKHELRDANLGLSLGAYTAIGNLTVLLVGSKLGSKSELGTTINCVGALLGAGIYCYNMVKHKRTNECIYEIKKAMNT